MTDVRIVVVRKPRVFPYDLDWEDAFSRAGAVLTTSEAPVVGDAYILLHSMTAQAVDVPWWVKKPCFMLVTNEFKFQKQRRMAADRVGAVIIGQNELPHALNPARYFERVKRAVRKKDFGYRGSPYPAEKIGDDDRRRIVDAFTGDIQWRLEPDWAGFLNSIRATCATEAGPVGNKILSPRHMEAIGTKTIQVMYPGAFSGVLRPEHYVTLNKDHSNLEEVQRMLADEAFCEELTSKAREEMLDCHTYDHRVRTLLARLS